MHRFLSLVLMAFVALHGCAARAQRVPAPDGHASGLSPVHADYTTTPSPFRPLGPASALPELTTLGRASVADGRVGDGRLSEVAAAIAAAGGEACDDIALVMSLSQTAGLTNPLPQALCVLASSAEAAAAALSKELPAAFRQLRTSHVGLGAAQLGESVMAVALLDCRRLTLAPVPRKLKQPGTVRVSAQVLAPLHDPRIVVTAPDGATHTEARGAGQTLDHAVALSERGTYGLELVAIGAHGPEVVANMRISVATDEPAFAPIPRGERAENAHEFEKLVHAALGSERKRRGLVALSRDAALDVVARAHATDMLKRRYFGHVDPDGRGPMDRLKAAGVAVVAMHENLARVASPAEAHALWLASPAHRAALLAENVHQVGVGAAATDDGSFLVVAMYVTRTPKAAPTSTRRRR